MELTGKTVVLKFWADWCQPCKMIAPIVKSACDKSGVPLVEVDVDADSELAATFGVRSIPMVVAIKDGVPVGTIVGSSTESKYMELITKMK